MSSFDPVSVIEAAYQMHANNERWMEGILEQAQPDLDAGMGTVMFEVIRDPIEGTSVGDVVTHRVEIEDAAERIIRLNQVLSEQAATTAYSPDMIYGSSSERTADLIDDFREDPYYKQYAHPVGVYDLCGTLITDPSGTQLVIAAPLPDLGTTTPEERRRWERLSAHIAAGYRLRRQLDQPAVDIDRALEQGNVDAVLTSQGTLEQAASQAVKQPEMRAEFERAAQSIDRARGGKRRSDPEQAVEMWKGLVSGEYSLVEHVDTDGRRFLLARKNAPDAAKPRALTRRERQVVHFVALGHSNQLIAYELGLNASTISTLLSQALSKLQLDSRLELIKLAASLRADQPDPTTSA